MTYAQTHQWQDFYGGCHRDPGGYLTRFKGTAAHANRKDAALPATHPAIVNSTTLFQKSIIDPEKAPRLLVSGFNSAKLGRVVLKGPWRGMPIFHLTLVERETCPRTCQLWRECFGNGMPLARRHRYTPALVPTLDRELRAAAVKHAQTGFVVRLHNLGDFPDMAYALAWGRWMRDLPELHVFGYTEHPAESQIGWLVNLLGALHPDRWMMRFSVAADDNPQPMQATTIWRQPEGSNVPEGLICPAQTHKTAACATCGLCWSPGATGKRIVFIGHGMSHGSRKDAA